MLSLSDITSQVKVKKMRKFLVNLSGKASFHVGHCFEYSSNKPSSGPVEAVYAALDRFEKKFNIVEVQEILKDGTLKTLKGYENFKRRPSSSQEKAKYVENYKNNTRN